MNCYNWGIFIWMGKIFGYLVQLFYSIFSNYGVAIILFTIATRVLMFPLSIKQQKSMAAQQRLQPKLEDLKRKYGDDRAAYSTAMQELYEKEGVSMNPGCLPMLIQMPLFIGMYMAIRRPLYCVLHIGEETINKLAALFNIDTKDFYYEINIIERLRSGALGSVTSGSDIISGADVTSASSAIVSMSDTVTSASDIVSGTDMAAVADILGNKYESVMEMCHSFKFLGFDLLQTAGFWNSALILALLVFVAQVGSMMLTNKINKVQTTNGCSMYGMAVFMGLFSLFISFSIPAAFPLYWLATSVISVPQAWVTREFFGPVVMNAQAEAQRNAKIKISEKAIADKINSRKGRISLAPSMPSEKGSTRQPENKGNDYSTKKKNKGSSNNSNKGNSDSYRGKKK